MALLSSFFFFLCFRWRRWRRRCRREAVRGEVEDGGGGGGGGNRMADAQPASSSTRYNATCMRHISSCSCLRGIPTVYLSRARIPPREDEEANGVSPTSNGRSFLSSSCWMVVASVVGGDDANGASRVVRCRRDGRFWWRSAGGGGIHGRHNNRIHARHQKSGEVRKTTGGEDSSEPPAGEPISIRAGFDHGSASGLDKNKDEKEEVGEEWHEGLETRGNHRGRCLTGLSSSSFFLSLSFSVSLFFSHAPDFCRFSSACFCVSARFSIF